MYKRDRLAAERINGVQAIGCARQGVGDLAGKAQRPTPAQPQGAGVIGRETDVGGGMLGNLAHIWVKLTKCQPVGVNRVPACDPNPMLATAPDSTANGATTYTCLLYTSRCV